MFPIPFVAVRSATCRRGCFRPFVAVALVAWMALPAGGLPGAHAASAGQAPTGVQPTPWKRAVDDRDHDIVVDTRYNSLGLPEFRGLTHVRARLATLVALLRDGPNMRNWVYRNKESRPLEVAPDHRHAITHVVTDMDWPLADRDAVIESHWSQDPATLEVRLTGNAIDGRLPESDRPVRMPVVHSEWRFRPVENGWTEVTFSGYGDPGGAFSGGAMGWFVRMALWEAPFETLKGLRAQISRPEYRDARGSWVREPGPDTALRR